MPYGTPLKWLNLWGFPYPQASCAEAAVSRLVEVASVVEPDQELTARYEARYQQFRELYPALKQTFAQLGENFLN